MHGILFNQLFRFILENYERKKLEEIKESAGVLGKLFLSIQSYPNAEFRNVIEASIEILDLPKEVLLERFGRYLTPELMKTYGTYIKKEWGLIDTLEHFERTVHRAVKNTMDHDDPLDLKIRRNAADEVAIDYTSKRQMIPFGIGIIHALADHYDEEIVISQRPITGGTSLSVKLK